MVRTGARSSRPLTRLFPAVVAGFLLSTLAGSPVHAEPRVETALRSVRTLDHRLHQARHHRRTTLERIAHLRTVLHTEQRRVGSPAQIGHLRWTIARRHLRGALFRVRLHVRTLNRFTNNRVAGLRRRRASIKTWLDTWGVLRRCPVAGPDVVADNFGVIVRLPGVPVHRHMGNDILAATGTPIVAPFKGYATTSSSALGGLEVRVTGAHGYVYNAHLSSLGSLGDVHTGEVIGYVGSTGDATAPHDHFEWHPAGGAAVDPNPLLSVVC